MPEQVFDFDINEILEPLGLRGRRWGFRYGDRLRAHLDIIVVNHTVRVVIYNMRPLTRQEALLTFFEFAMTGSMR